MIATPGSRTGNSFPVRPFRQQRCRPFVNSVPEGGSHWRDIGKRNRFLSRGVCISYATSELSPGFAVGLR